MKCAVISSEAKFNLAINENLSEVKYMTAPVIGDATESALIRFFQPIQDIGETRTKN
jgi:sodium/potassium-transporting ATPase subunit alpha